MRSRSFYPRLASGRRVARLCLPWVILATKGLTLGSAAEPEPPALSSRLLAVGSVPHDARDKEGETLGAFGSGLCCDGAQEGRYLAVADRGPGDGTIDYRPRYQALRVERDVENPARLHVTVEGTTLFSDAERHPYSGFEPDRKSSAAARGPVLKDGRACLDPEAMVTAPDGTLYVADEYGPFVYQFDREGRLLRVLHPPEGYLPRDAQGALDFGSNEDLAAGRTTNRGFEGLAISPDGHTLTALLQSALTQDGGKGGGVTRLLAFDAESGRPVAEYAYAMENAAAASERLGLKHDDRLKTKNLSVCELHAVDAGRFLAIERDNRGLDGSAQSQPAAAKGVWLVNLAGATNLLSLPGQPYTLSTGAATTGYTPLSEAVARGSVRPVGKRLLIDLVRACQESRDPAFADGVPEKWEGLALRPAGEPGHYTLLTATDNDFLSPVLHFKDRGDVPFPKAKQALDTCILLFDVTIP